MFKTQHILIFDQYMLGFAGHQKNAACDDNQHVLFKNQQRRVQSTTHTGL